MRDTSLSQLNQLLFNLLYSRNTFQFFYLIWVIIIGKEAFIAFYTNLHLIKFNAPLRWFYYEKTVRRQDNPLYTLHSERRIYRFRYFQIFIPAHRSSRGRDGLFRQARRGYRGYRLRNNIPLFRSCLCCRIGARIFFLPRKEAETKGMFISGAVVLLFMVLYLLGYLITNKYMRIFEFIGYVISYLTFAVICGRKVFKRSDK